MSYAYKCTFNLGECIKTLGLNEKGRVQQVIDQTVLKVCDPYVPFDNGFLKESAYVDNGGGEIVWPGPYAHYLYEGIVYEDPDLHCAGFLTDNGWFSKKGVQKVPTERKLQFQGAPLRGAKWVDRAMEAGGMEAVEEAAREEIKR